MSSRSSSSSRSRSRSRSSGDRSSSGYRSSSSGRSSSRRRSGSPVRGDRSSSRRISGSPVRDITEFACEEESRILSKFKELEKQGAVSSGSIDEWIKKFKKNPRVRPKSCRRFGGGELKGGMAETVVAEPDTIKAADATLQPGMTGDHPPHQIQKLFKRNKELKAMLLVKSRDSGRFLLVRFSWILNNFYDAVLLGVYFKVNYDIGLQLGNGMCCIWNNSTWVAPFIGNTITMGLGSLMSGINIIMVTGVELTYQGAVLAGFTHPVWAASLGACACLFGYLLYKYFNYIETINLSEPQVQQIKTARINYLQKALREEAERIGRGKLELTQLDDKTSESLTQIGCMIESKHKVMAIIREYIKLFHAVNKPLIDKLYVAQSCFSYISKWVYKIPRGQIETVHIQLKEMTKLLFGQAGGEYNAKELAPKVRFALLKLETRHFFNLDVPALLPVISIPLSAAKSISEKITDTHMSGRLHGLRSRLCKDIEQVGELWKVAAAPPYAASGGSSRRRKKQKNKRKTIRRKPVKKLSRKKSFKKTIRRKATRKLKRTRSRK